MKKAFLCVAVLATTSGAVATGWAQQPAPGQAKGSATLSDCLVTLIDEANVGPQEAGVITAIEAYEGLDVEEGALLALIDDSLVRSEKAVAEAEQNVAKAEAENDTEERVAKATVVVADLEHKQVKAANQQAQGAKSLAEVRIKEFTVYKSQAQVAQAQMNRRIAGIKADAAAEKVKATDIAIQRRRIESPLTGKVVKVFSHKGEWATPEKPVLRIVRLDRLRVTGFVDYQQFNPGDLHARPVTLNVKLAGERPAQFEGKITFVNPVVVPNTSQYEIHAEVVNRQENGEWVLQPGLNGTLTVDMTQRITAQAPAPGPALTR